MAEATPKIQVVDGDGQFLEPQLEQFVHATRLPESKGNYQVVAIMGPQSSGKSTLLNHVFGTSFVMMDALTGRSQTTKGIWLARASKITDHTTLVMDLEGNDGRERGEDDTNFERQIALFALAVADVLLVNIWCHDIGREQASGKPLLKTIFQVNLKLFAPEPNRKRTILLFVIRDKTKTPVSKLVEVLEKDLDRIWDEMAKPAQYEQSKMSDFFQVEYATMSHYEEKYDDFVADANVLRRRFSPDSDDTLVTPNDHLPGAAFVLSTHTIWDTIKQQKDLNLPAHKIMVANIRCAEIARDQLAAFQDDQAWQGLEKEATSPSASSAGKGPELVPGFSTRLAALLDSCVQGYEEDAMYFDATVRGEKLLELQAKLTEVVAPALQAQTQALHAKQLEELRRDLVVALVPPSSEVQADGAAPNTTTTAPVQFTSAAATARASAVSTFKKLFTEHLRLDRKGWEGKEALAAFEAAADALVAGLRAERVNEALAAALRRQQAALSGPVAALLDECPAGVWPKLHGVVAGTSEAGAKALLQALSGYTLTPPESKQVVQKLKDAAWQRLESHVREAALTRMSRMKDRFSEAFTLDANKAPRTWRPHENIPALAKQARLEAAFLLAQLAVIRLPGQAAAAGPDAVEQGVMKLARRDVEEAGTGQAEVDGFDGVADLVELTSWPGVDEAHVLVAPHEARATWKSFMTSSNSIIQQAQATQQANRLASNRAPPLWALLAILVLGWNEFVALLWNPVYLILGALLFLFGRSVYQELDVETEMAQGSLPGALSLAAKIGPAVRSVAQRTQRAALNMVQHPEEQVERVRQLMREMELTGMDSPSKAQRYAVQDEGAGAAGASTGAAAGSGGRPGVDGVAGGNVSASGLSQRRAGKEASAAASSAAS